MTTLANTNLRGIRISPQVKEDTVHYYLCIIDQPASAAFDPAKLSVAALEAGATEIMAHYSGKLVDPNGTEPVKSYMLPLITSQQLAVPNAYGTNLKIQVTDDHHNIAKGNPNSGRPPVIAPVDNSKTLLADLLIIRSLTNENDCFVVPIVNTAVTALGDQGNGGFANYFPIASEGAELTASLVPKAEVGPRAAVGAIASTHNQYSSLLLTAGAYSAAPQEFTYDNLHFV